MIKMMHGFKTMNLTSKHAHCHFTCIAICSSPSSFTQETRSTLYVARAVFTVGRTRGVTVNAEKTGILTA